MKSKLLMTFCALWTYGVHAYECKSTSIQETTNPAHFLDNKDGTVTDLRFGLVWSVCTFGQTFDKTDQTCKGEPKAANDWATAIATQDEINAQKFAGYSDWRLPNIKELNSIVERQCRQPSIKLSIFKGTINSRYWSNTPDDLVNPSFQGRVIDFSDGVEFARPTTNTSYVRHVRKI